MQFVQVTNPASQSTQKKATTVSLKPLASFEKGAYLSKLQSKNFEEGLLNVITVNEAQNGSVQGPQQIKELNTDMDSVFKTEKVMVAQQYVKIVDNISSRPGNIALNPNGPQPIHGAPRMPAPGMPSPYGGAYAPQPGAYPQGPGSYPGAYSPAQGGYPPTPGGYPAPYGG